MTTRKRKTAALRAFLKGATATVSLHRNGLSIEIPNVPAPLAFQVAGELLNGARGLVNVGFSELIPDAGGVHGGAFGEVPEEAEDYEAKRIGFTG